VVWRTLEAIETLLGDLAKWWICAELLDVFFDRLRIVGLVADGEVRDDIGVSVS
jgi:hypothetical protein